MYLATGGKLQEVDVSSLGEPHPAAKALYFTVNDLEAAHGRAKSLHCLSSEDVHDAPGGGIVVRPWGERSFYVLDPWKNPLCFVARQKTAATCIARTLSPTICGLASVSPLLSLHPLCTWGLMVFMQIDETRELMRLACD
jgi:hypothetical protein